MYWWWSKYVKGIVGVNVNNSIVWGVDNCVGAGFDRTYVDEVYSDIGDVVGEVFELEVGDEVDFWNERSWRWYHFSIW